MIKTVTDYLNGKFATAKEALDDAANQISRRDRPADRAMT